MECIYSLLTATPIDLIAEDRGMWGPHQVPVVFLSQRLLFSYETGRKAHILVDYLTDIIIDFFVYRAEVQNSVYVWME